MKIELIFPSREAIVLDGDRLITDYVEESVQGDIDDGWLNEQQKDVTIRERKQEIIDEERFDEVIGDTGWGNLGLYIISGEYSAGEDLWEKHSFDEIIIRAEQPPVSQPSSALNLKQQLSNLVNDSLSKLSRKERILDWRDKSNTYYELIKETTDLIASEIYTGLMEDLQDEETASYILRMALKRYLEEGFGDEVVLHNEDEGTER